MYRKQIDEFIDSHQEEMLEDLKTLVRIDSQRGEAKPGKPFGDGSAQVLAAAQEIIKKYGFTVKNYDNYVVTGDFSDKERQLDILAHLDVVPVTEDWTVTKPFDPIVKDGKLFGRGTIDDKGPAIAALYAMRAVKETGIELSKSVRLILGSDEECGSSDLLHYYNIEKEAPMSFTPDADFPVINVEKGRLSTEFTAEFVEGELPSVIAFEGGAKSNVVPADAFAVVKGISEEQAQEAAKGLPEGVTAQITREGDDVRIQLKGMAAHACTPELGKNAVCALAEMLLRLPLAQTKSREAIQNLEKLFPYGDVTGKALGIAMEDPESGALTMNLGIVKMDGKKMTAVFDSRVPICGNDENVTKVVLEQMRGNGFQMDDVKMVPPHNVPADTLLVKTLLDTYEKYTGQKGEARSTGGGTYVHHLKNGVAFGCMFDDVDNHMHGDDEFIEVDVLLMSAKMFADAIVKLCK